MFLASKNANATEVSMFGQASRTGPMFASTGGLVFQLFLALLLSVAVIATTVPLLMRAVQPDTIEGMTLDLSAVP